jgi:hypothetical protein
MNNLDGCRGIGNRSSTGANYANQDSLALVPALGLVCSLAITNDSVSPVEWAAISAISTGVAIGARPRWARRVPRSAPA